MSDFQTNPEDGINPIDRKNQKAYKRGRFHKYRIALTVVAGITLVLLSGACLLYTSRCV